jgi:carbonic anhydrase/acetyltransferase-like protein (isoleucine patch superfamily)
MVACEQMHGGQTPKDLFTWRLVERKRQLTGLILAFRGAFPTIAADAFIAETAVVIGDVTIAPRASIWYGCVLRGDVNYIRVGERTNIQDGTIIHVRGRGMPTVIGADVTIGHRALLHACTLEDGSFVGMAATVMDGAVVESGAMVAAGALVTPGKVVKKGELWAGSPAKLLRPLTPADIAGFAASIERYVNLSKSYLDEAREP